MRKGEDSVACLTAILPVEGTWPQRGAGETMIYAPADFSIYILHILGNGEVMIVVLIDENPRFVAVEAVPRGRDEIERHQMTCA